MKKVAILQSNYIPWKGYFDIIASVDQFIILDCVQYTCNDWRNRNKIKTRDSLLWLTVPVLAKGRHTQLIRDVEIADKFWPNKHWRSLETNYSKSKYFCEISEWLKPLYLEREYKFLSDLNKTFIVAISNYLELNTEIIDSSQFSTSSKKSKRLIEILTEVKADIYYSGPSAKSYINEEQFNEHGFKVSWMDYSDYPIYSQQWKSFVHEVSILDLLFNCGFESRNYMKFKK